MKINILDMLWPITAQHFIESSTMASSTATAAIIRENRKATVLNEVTGKNEKMPLFSTTL